MKLDKKLYSATTKVTGGRENGRAISDDNQLDISIGSPKELGGDGKSGTNPEQLFSAGYAACFIGALGVAAKQKQLVLPENLHIDSKVFFGTVGEGFGVAAELHVHLPGLEQAVADDLVQCSHQICPYSNATRNNIEVDLLVSV